ncbi:MAG: glycogen synthase GlgA [Pseudomonadota bacterium]
MADVVSALPKALGRVGVTVRVLMPAYPALAPLAANGVELARLDDPVGGAVRVLGVGAEGLSLLLLDAPDLFAREGGIYLGPDGRDWPDNAERFATLSSVAATIAMDGIDGWTPDILHAHDWQAGFAPVYLRERGGAAGTVTTIHNVAFQGLAPAHLLGRLALPGAAFDPEGFEYYGQISALKAGLFWSDRITTVSPTYARELAQPEFGMGFEGILAARRDRMQGILNGIDEDVWDPQTDPALAQTYGSDTLNDRAANRAALVDRFGLDPLEGAPLFCVVSRLTRQKGLDLLLDVLPRLVARGAGLVVLGSGDPDLEAGFRAATAEAPGRIGLHVGYDEPLSHLMQGGADAILIPSRFEPCGLTQLYGLRYGCVPVVATTGGLADTVIDANDAGLVAGAATGVQFSPVTAPALGDAIDRACDLFADPAAWRDIVRRGMAHPVGWQRSAEVYARLYQDVSVPLPK